MLPSCLKKLESEGRAAVSLTCGAITGYMGTGEQGRSESFTEDHDAFRDPPIATSPETFPQFGTPEWLDRIHEMVLELVNKVKTVESELSRQALDVREKGEEKLLADIQTKQDEVKNLTKHIAAELREVQDVIEVGVYVKILTLAKLGGVEFPEFEGKVKEWACSDGYKNESLRKASGPDREAGRREKTSSKDKAGTRERTRPATVITGASSTAVPPTQSPEAGEGKWWPIVPATVLRDSCKLHRQSDYYQAGLRRQIVEKAGPPTAIILGEFTADSLRPRRTMAPLSFRHIEDLQKTIYSGEVPLYEFCLTTFVKKGMRAIKGEIVAVAEATMHRGSWAKSECRTADTYEICTLYRDHQGVSTRCAPGFPLRKVALGRSPFGVVSVGGYLVVLVIDSAQVTEFSFDHSGLVTDCCRCVEELTQGLVRGQRVRLFREEPYLFAADEPPKLVAPALCASPPVAAAKGAEDDESKSDIFSSEGPVDVSSDRPRTLGELRPFRLVTGLGSGFIDARRCANCLSSLYGPLKLLNNPTSEDKWKQYTMPRLNALAMAYAEMCANYNGICKATQDNRAECEKTLKGIFEIIRTNKEIAAIPILW